MIPLAFILYSALLSMFSYVKVPVVIRFFSFSAWLSMTAPLRQGVFLIWMGLPATTKPILIDLSKAIIDI